MTPKLQWHHWCTDGIIWFGTQPNSEGVVMFWCYHHHLFSVTRIRTIVHINVTVYSYRVLGERAEQELVVSWWANIGHPTKLQCIVEWENLLCFMISHCAAWAGRWSHAVSGVRVSPRQVAGQDVLSGRMRSVAGVWGVHLKTFHQFKLGSCLWITVIYCIITGILWLIQVYSCPTS